MSQDPNQFYPPTSPGMYPSYPPTQTGPFGQYPAQVNEYPPYSSQPSKIIVFFFFAIDLDRRAFFLAEDSHVPPPPYAQATTANNYGQAQPMGFPPVSQPGVTPTGSFPKGSKKVLTEFCLSHGSVLLDESVTGGGWGKFTGLESKEIRRAFVRKVCRHDQMIELFHIRHRSILS